MHHVLTHVHDRTPGERVSTGQQVETDYADRIDVGTRVDPVRVAEPLWGDVQRRAGHHLRHGDLHLLRRDHVLDQPEIEHLDEVGLPAALAQDDIQRFDVTMDQPAFVRLLQ